MTEKLPTIERIEPCALIPRSMAEAMKLAEMIADTPFVPKDMRGRPGDVFAAIALGLEVGLGPMTALQHIAVINGRPSVWGDVALALVMASGALEDMHEEVTDEKAVCTVKRRGREPITRTFSIEDAKRAGLLGKPGPWQQYPRRMLQMRARSWALRDAFPDVLKGIAIREEALDIDAAPVETRTVAASGQKPRRGVAAIKAAVAGGKENRTEVIAPETGEVTEAASKPPAPETPAAKAEDEKAPVEEPAAEGKTRRSIPLLGADGSVVARVGSGRGWLALYRELCERSPEQRWEVMRRNLETLRKLAARAPAELKQEFEEELAFAAQVEVTS